MVDQVLPRRGRHVLCGKASAESLQRLARVVELEHVAGIEPHDDGAAVRNALDQSAALKCAEHLADARAGHRELIGQIMLTQLGAWRNFLAGDALAQGVQNLGHRRLTSPRTARALRTRLRLVAQAHNLVSHRAQTIPPCCFTG
jgi:hypothetical protein